MGLLSVVNPSKKKNLKKVDNPCFGHAYEEDSGSKSGLKCRTDGMESAAGRSTCVLPVLFFCLQ